ncbi:MAG: DUF4230 domain-containing protein [Verrucomicrobia bacterium]|nr:DUF4230 domain-containing protein [Verrucomicrobiota bacterium]MBI3868249.1 DUF4230 domain-containing protein [Verrucomicrobiota bacterium]
MTPSRWILATIAGVAAGVVLLIGLIAALLFFGFAPRRPTTIAPTTTLVTQVQALNDLVMVKYVVEKVVKLESEPSLLGEDRIVLLVHAVVKAGVDLHSLRAEDIEVKGGRLTLRLPAARITDCYIDDKRTQVWEHSTRFWRPLDKDLEQNARRQALDQVRAAAGDQGIQKEALQRARDQLRWLLGSLGFKDVEVTQRAP